MGRRPRTIRGAHAAPAWLTEPAHGLLRWSLAAVALLLFGCAAHAQGSLIAPASAKPSGNDARAAAAVHVRAASNFARLPLSFEANRGQTDARVKFLSRGPGYTLFLTQQEAVFAFAPPARSGQANAKPRASALRLRFEGADSSAEVSGQDELPGKTNYFLTSDRSTWHTGIPNYSQVDYRNLYPGVNAVFHGNPGRLEFDFEVVPGANASKIALDIVGGRPLRLDGDGNIVLGVGKHGRGGEVTLGKPAVYQQIAGERREIPGRFVMRSRHRIGFELGAYDRSRPLVIDPSISYSTYLGGGVSGGNAPNSYGQAIAVDSLGNAYVTGETTATDFPTPTGTGGTGQPLTFVSKFSTGGSSLVYTSFLPFGFGAGAIAVDSNYSAYLGGVDPYYVATSGAYANGAGLTVIKLTADGSGITYAAQLGPAFPSTGTLYGLSIAVDTQGSAYVAAATNELSFPTTSGTIQTACWSTGCTAEATVTKLSPDGSSLVYSTLLGGHGGDYATGIAVDANFDAYVTGATGSTDFPTTTGVLQPSCSSSTGYSSTPPNCSDIDAFVSELNPTGTALIYSTFLGNGIILSNGEDQQIGIALDAAGNAYIAGSTDSTVFTNGLSAGAGPTNLGPPVTCGSEYMICPDSISFEFLAKVAPGGGTLAYLGFLGGYNASPIGAVNGYTFGGSVAADSSGNAYLTGVTTSNYFPVTSDAFLSSFQEVWPYAGNLCSSTSDCGSEAYLSILNTELSGSSSLVYSTYLGAATLELNPTLGLGIAVDGSENAWLTGQTTSATFPTTSGALQSLCTLDSSSPPYCDDYAFVTEFATATTVPASAIAAVSGGGQSATIGTSFANPLMVKVTDSSGNPVSGATVTFTGPTSGASASFSSAAPTASDGTTSVTATANGIASGSAYQVSAAVSGVSTPATFSLTNLQAATTLTVIPSGVSLVYGQMVTINASISPASVLTTTPTGSVAFYDGATALTPNSTVAGAAASYTVNVPTVGSHTYAAQYLGDTNFAASALTSATSAVVVNKAAVTLGAPGTVRLQAGTAGSIPVTIAGQYTGSGIADPTGGLSYSVSGNAFGPGSLLVANGNATIPVPGTLPTGTYTVTLSYAGDLNYNSNSIQIQLVVYPALSIGPATLAAGIVGGNYSQTLTATGGSGSSYTFAVTAGTALSAVGLTLSPAGVISGTPTGSETAAALMVKVTDSQGDTVTQSFTLTIYPALSIGPATLPLGIVGVSYSQTLTATGGSGSNYQWGVTSGTALSAVGLTLSSAGVISGNPSAPETAAAFTVDVVDSLGNVTTMTYHLTINPALSIAPATLPAGNVGAPYSQTLTASGGSGSGYTFTVIAGTALSAVGLTLSPSGTITGTPNATETAAAFTVQVTDSLGDMTTQNCALTINSALGPITINDPETITVNDSMTQVQLVDVSDPETITVTDTPVVTLAYTIGGTVSGLSSGVSLTLLDNGADSLTITANGAFTFATALATGAAYDVTIGAQPSGETCTVSGGSGTVYSANVTSVAVACKATTTTTLVISPSPASYGEPVTFAARVTPAVGSGTPTGTVTFTCLDYAPGQSINSGPIDLVNGVADWTATNLAGDIYNNCFIATYSGDANFLPSASAPESLTVIDFQFQVAPPANVDLWPGQSTSFTFTLAPANGAFNGTVDFVVTGLPAGVTATFNPSAVTLGSNPVTVTVTLTAASFASVREPGQAPGKAVPLMFALLLVPLLGLGPVRRRLRRGGWFVLLALLPFIALAGIIACGGSGFFNQSPQTYSVTLTATSGTAQQSTTFNLIVE